MREHGRMRLRIFTEPQQGASYATLSSVARATEDLGFDAFFRSDHYLRFGAQPARASAPLSAVRLCAVPPESAVAP